MALAIIMPYFNKKEETVHKLFSDFIEIYNTIL